MAGPNPSSFGDYGGEKSDYQIGVTSATTDRSGASASQALSDLSMMSRTCPRAIALFVTGGTGAVTGVVHEAQWGVSVAPVIARTGVGVFTVTWPTTIVDPRGNNQTINLRFAKAWTGTTLGYATTQTMTSPNVMTVKVFRTDTQAAADTTGMTVTVEAS